jgi:riboflavin kinase/FMN adenylyltransferase
MHVFRGLPNPESRSPCALTIGNFDGVHRGHAALLQKVVHQARQSGLPAAVMTFEPHPREYFAARAGHLDQAPARIANLRDKLEALAQAGIDRVIVEHFNARFAALTAQQFIENILVQGCHARWICVGDDFRFGTKRSGDFDLLRRAGQQWGFGVEAMPTLMHDGLRISSSEVRQALASGNFALTQELLGRPYMMSGRVIHGKKLGRTLGFPTLNLRVTHKRPAVAGIFVVRVHGLAEQALPGVASLGVRPTVEDDGRVLLETHVLDWQGDAYGRLIRVELLKKLRDEEKYDSLGKLTTAIAEDERQARGYFLAINEF